MAFEIQSAFPNRIWFISCLENPFVGMFLYFTFCHH